MCKFNLNPKANQSKQKNFFFENETDRKRSFPIVSLVYCERSLHEIAVISIISNIVNCKSFDFCNNLLYKQPPLGKSDQELLLKKSSEKNIMKLLCLRVSNQLNTFHLSPPIT